MEEFNNEDLDTSLAGDATEEVKAQQPKQGMRLEDCLNILDKLEGARTNEEIHRFATTLVMLGIFDRSSFGNLEPVGFLKKMMPYMKHEVFTEGSAILHINQPVDRACVIVRGKAKEFIPRNAREIERESKNSLSNIKEEKKIRTMAELEGSENKLLVPKPKNIQLPRSLSNIVEENEQDITSPVKKRRGLKVTTTKPKPLNTNPNHPISLNSLDKPLSARSKMQDEAQQSKATLKSSLKTNSASISGGTLNSLDEETGNEEFLEEFKKFPKNYFIGEVLKVKASKSLGTGSRFGTHSFGKKMNSKQAIMATEECHCITLYKEDYAATLAAEKTLHRDKIEFFCNMFPSLNQEAVTEFSLLWDEQIQKRGDIIFQENDQSNQLYVVFNGEITISKEVNELLMARRNSDGMSLIKKKNSPLQIATFCQGYFFGEEFFEKKNRIFTATTSSSKAKILHLSKKDYKAIAKKYSEIFAKIKEMVRASSKLNAQRLEGLYQTYKLDLDREKMQAEFLSQKEQVLKSERPLRRGNAKSMTMIMKPTKKPKNINLRLQYDKYFVCKPGQKYPEYLKMVIGGNIKPDPTERNQQLDSKRISTQTLEQKRRISTPVLREPETEDTPLNHSKPVSHQKVSSLYKMTQIPIQKDDQSSKYQLSAPNTFRITVNSSALPSERETIEDPLIRQNYYQFLQPRTSLLGGEVEITGSVDNEQIYAASTTNIPIRSSEYEYNQQINDLKTEGAIIYSEKKFSKIMKGMNLKYSQKERLQVNEYTPMVIKSSQNTTSGQILKVPSNSKLLSGYKENTHSVTKSLNNLPSIPSTLTNLNKFELKDKQKGPEVPKLPSLKTPRRKNYGSLNDLNEIFSMQERRSLINTEVGSLKKL